MPFHICWHTTQCLVIFSILINGLPQTTSDRTSTETTTSKRLAQGCPGPPALSNGYYEDVTPNQWLVKIAHCNNGYELMGPSRFWCMPEVDYVSEGRIQPKMRWYPDFAKPTCKPSARVTTKEPAIQSVCLLSKPKNPHVEIRDWRGEYPVGSGVVYTCKRGYVIVGQAERWCKANGIWLPEEEPECIDKDDVDIMSPERDPGDQPSESTSIMKIILYISIPLLVMFALAMVCSFRRQCSKRNRQSLVRSSFERNDPSFPQLLPTSTTGLNAHPHHPMNTPTAPPSHMLDSEDFTIPIIMTEDAPGPVIHEPPSYEEATRDSCLPSFEVAQKIHNSRENLH